MPKKKHESDKQTSVRIGKASDISGHANVARMAPNVLDIVVATLAIPLAGLGVAVKKIAEKAKQERVYPR